MTISKLVWSSHLPLCCPNPLSLFPPPFFFLVKSELGLRRDIESAWALPPSSLLPHASRGYLWIWESRHRVRDFRPSRQWVILKDKLVCGHARTPEVPLRRSRTCKRREPVGSASHRPRGHARPRAAPAPRAAPRPGPPHGQLRPCRWPAANTSGELIESKFPSYETEMDGSCLGAGAQ